MKNTKTLYDRTGFEDAFQNMMSSPKFVEKSFYSFVIAKMQVTIDKSVPTAGVGFQNNNFHLVINPDFFNPLPLKQRIGILVHEADHILLKHVFRKGTRDHRLFNIACDIALNQYIGKDWLPEGGMFPDSFKDEKGKPWPSNLTAEAYYDLLKEEKDRQEDEKSEKEDQEKCDNPNGSGGDQEKEDSEGGEDSEDSEGEGQEPGNGFKPSNGNPNLTGSDEMTLDSHDMWDEMTEADEELAKEMMEKILEDAQEKSRGNLPGNIERILELWKRAPKLSWKKILKRYISSKKGDRVATIKRRNRRIRTLGVRGKKTSFDTPEVVVGVDTSGSMSNEEIVNGLIEINQVCKLTGSNLKVIQIDTDIKSIEEYDVKKKEFKRNGYGGTYMGAIVEYIKKEKIKMDVLIMISDMEIENLTTDKNWLSFKKPVLWLSWM